MSWDQVSDEEWQQFVNQVREDVVKQMADSALVTTINPGDREPDVKLAVETGMAILLDKPMLLLAKEGDPIPAALERAAYAVIRYSGDLDTEEGKQEVFDQLEPYLDEFQVGSGG